MLVTAFGNRMLVRLEQLAKTLVPRLIVLLGIVTLLRRVQLRKAASAIFVMLVPNVTVVRLVQYMKALVPRIFTLLVVMRLVRYLLLKKAPVPMATTGNPPSVAGMFTVPLTPV